MYTISVTKEILTGPLSGIVVQEKYNQLNPDDPRKVGKKYKGITHQYRILSINSVFNEPKF